MVEMLRQVSWAAPPEMAVECEDRPPAPSRSPMLGRWYDVELELDAESAQEGTHLVGGPPYGSTHQWAAQAAGRAPIVALVLAFVGASAVVVSSMNDQRRALLDAARSVGLALGPYSSIGETTLESQSVEGQPFVYVRDALQFQAGDAIVVDAGSDHEEIQHVEDVYNDAGCVRLHRGLEFQHPKGTPVTASEYTSELQDELERRTVTEYTRVHSKVMQLGAQPGDMHVEMTRGCFEFHPGDRVELADRKTGQHEYNMITSILLNAGQEERLTCSFLLAYPVTFRHDASAEPWPEISKMADVVVGSSTTSFALSSSTTSFALGSLDVNGDGDLSRAEALAGGSGQAAEVAALFPSLDADGNGCLSEGEASGYKTLDADGDGFVSEDEALGSAFIKAQFPNLDKNGDGKLSLEELEGASKGWEGLAGLGENEAGGKVGKKKVWAAADKDPWAAEAAARFPDTDKDQDGSLSREEAASYKTLDSNSDGFINKAETESDGYVRGKFAEWDENADEKLDKRELLKAAMGAPQIVFTIGSVDSRKFIHDNCSLFQNKTRASEELIARDLEGVDESRVLVKLSDGPSGDAALQRSPAPPSVPPRRSLEEPAAQSLRVDAWIDGDTSQVQEKLKKVDEDMVKLYVQDENMMPYIVGSLQQVQVSSIASVPRGGGDTHAGMSLPLLLGLLCCLVAVAAVVLFYLRPSGTASGMVFAEATVDGPVVVPTERLDVNYAAAPRGRTRWDDSPPEAVVVPGGGLAKDGKLLPWVEERLKKASQLYEEVNEVRRQLAEEEVDSSKNDDNNSKASSNNNGTNFRRAVIVTMCEGIRYSPRDPKESFNEVKRLESQLSAEFLKGIGVADEDIVKDELSVDTMGNAYFLRTTHTNLCQARSLVIVTNEFHMDRVRVIFDKMFSLGPFPDGGEPCSLVYESIPNLSMQKKALERRVAWEKQQIEEFDSVARSWNDLHDAHAHLFPSPEGRANRATDDLTRRGLPSSSLRTATRVISEA